MKIHKLFFTFVAISLIGCDDNYIDDISSVDPGADEEAPTVTINYPLEGTAVRVVEEVTDITISFSASDDIELKTVAVQLDGEEIATYDAFVDFRNMAVDDLVFEGLTNGEHTLQVQVTDVANKTSSQSVAFEKLAPYEPMENEIFYLPFDGEYVDLVTLTTGTKVGSPVFETEDVISGISSYKGVEGAYVTFPTTGLTNPEFSASFWMKINAVPTHAGILVMGPEDAANPNAQNLRTSGFRFFREPDTNVSTKQRFKLNVGTGTGDVWFDGGDAANIAPEDFDVWHHFAFTISQSEATVYIDGEIVSSGAFGGVNWTGINLLSIMSGAPRFTGWNHLSDQSLMDELRIFDKELTQEEVQALMAIGQPD